MTLERLQSEMIAAMKNKDKERKETISGIIQAVKKFGIYNVNSKGMIVSAKAMGGDIFADIENGYMCVSVVCRKN